MMPRGKVQKERRESDSVPTRGRKGKKKKQIPLPWDVSISTSLANTSKLESNVTSKVHTAKSPIKGEKQKRMFCFPPSLSPVPALSQDKNTILKYCTKLMPASPVGAS
jgi:hypothetical protein